MADDKPIDISNISVIEFPVAAARSSSSKGQKDLEPTNFVDPETGAPNTVVMERKKAIPYTFGNRYFQCSFDLPDQLESRGVSKEALSVFRRLVVQMEYGNWASITSYRALGIAARRDTPLLPQHVYRALIELEFHGIIKRPPGGRKVFVNPNLCYRGGGADQNKSSEEWGRWCSAENRKHQKQRKSGGVA